MKKKFYSIVLFAALLMAFGSMTAFANNSSDTTFSFEFPFGKNTVYTAARSKTDASSSYMKLTTMSNKSYSYNATVVNSNYANFSKVWTNRFTSTDINRGRYLSNYAKENGARSVRIKGTRVGSTNIEYWMSGVWSPDSI